MLGSRNRYGATGLNTGCTYDAPESALHNIQIPGPAINTENPDITPPHPPIPWPKPPTHSPPSPPTPHQPKHRHISHFPHVPPELVNPAPSQAHTHVTHSTYTSHHTSPGRHTSIDLNSLAANTHATQTQEEEKWQTQSTYLTTVFSTRTAPQEYRQMLNRVRQMSY